MRVISGTAKGKKLNSLEGLETRPTLDRVKEAIFNIIQFNIKEAKVLDLFSGSGAMGIEALSRGSKSSVLSDNSSKAIEIIKENLKQTRLEDRATVINKDFLLVLDSLHKKNEQFNIIFLDPPYKTDFVLKSIDKIVNLNLLAENGIVIVETNDKEIQVELEKNKNIEVYDKRKYGKVFITFIRKG